MKTLLTAVAVVCTFSSFAFAADLTTPLTYIGTGHNCGVFNLSNSTINVQITSCVTPAASDGPLDCRSYTETLAPGQKIGFGPVFMKSPDCLATCEFSFSGKANQVYAALVNAGNIYNPNTLAQAH